jgi:hypothetical protein
MPNKKEKRPMSWQVVGDLHIDHHNIQVVIDGLTEIKRLHGKNSRVYLSGDRMIFEMEKPIPTEQEVKDNEHSAIMDAYRGIVKPR